MSSQILEIENQLQKEQNLNKKLENNSEKLKNEFKMQIGNVLEDRKIETVRIERKMEKLSEENGDLKSEVVSFKAKMANLQENRNGDIEFLRNSEQELKILNLKLKEQIEKNDKLENEKNDLVKEVAKLNKNEEKVKIAKINENAKFKDAFKNHFSVKILDITKIIDKIEKTIEKLTEPILKKSSSLPILPTNKTKNGTKTDLPKTQNLTKNRLSNWINNLLKNKKKRYVVNLNDHSSGDFIFNEKTGKWINNNDKDDNKTEKTPTLPPKRKKTPQKIQSRVVSDTNALSRYASNNSFFGYGDSEMNEKEKNGEKSVGNAAKHLNELRSEIKNFERMLCAEDKNGFSALNSAVLKVTKESNKGQKTVENVIEIQKGFCSIIGFKEERAKRD
ncbi:hypothetical protein MHBO_002661 [Bonamia ostreae]|uniref:Uncharacterized protein n=1 Tax=Bonamia ostreae TaxID=126728 RepID=A0ABV2AN22_9EUKA